MVEPQGGHLILKKAFREEVLDGFFVLGRGYSSEAIHGGDY